MSGLATIDGCKEPPINWIQRSAVGWHRAWRFAAIRFLGGCAHVPRGIDNCDDGLGGSR